MIIVELLIFAINEKEIHKSSLDKDNKINRHIEYNSLYLCYSIKA